MPDNENLAKVRQEIDYNFKKFDSILKNKKFKTTFNTFDDFDKLKTAPKGYPKDHPHIEWLKYKSFIVSHYFTDTQVKEKTFLKKVIETCKTAKPLNDFLLEARA
jgi:uncharacterized protein (TIGR02453 family)